MSTIATKRFLPTITPDLVFLVLGVILVIVQYLLAPIPLQVQVILCAAAVVCLGIPHGALDHLVEAKNSLLQKQNFSLLSFLARYLGKMILFGIVWLLYPPVAFLAFIVISAIHFGETDLIVLSGSKNHSLWLQLSHGSLVLGFLLLTHMEETLSILNTFPDIFPAWLNLRHVEMWVPASLVFLAAIHALALYTLMSSDFALINYLAKTVVLLSLMTMLPLILAFTFYFGLWHSFHTLNVIRGHLSESASPLSWMDVLKRSIPFSLAAFLLLSVLLFWATATYQLPMMLMFFFIGIAILTAPHLDVMHKMYKGRH